MDRTPPALPQDRHTRRKKLAGPPHLVVRQSTIDTEGCYTTVPIGKGEFVVEYTGRRLTIQEANALYDKHYRTYLFGLLDGRHVIDGEGVAAFINHSCEPNCEVEEVDGRILIAALRDIAADEELTYDYNLYDGELDDPALCRCGAFNCRGSMYSEDELARRARQLRHQRRRERRSRSTRR